MTAFQLAPARADVFTTRSPMVPRWPAGRFYERIGNYAVDIAGRASFVSTGELPSS